MPCFTSGPISTIHVTFRIQIGLNLNVQLKLLLLLVIIQDIMIPPRLILTIDEILWYIFSCCCCYINAVCQNSFRKDWSRFCVCWEDMWGMHRWAALSEWLEAQSRVLHPPGLLLFARKWSKLSGIGMALLTPINKISLRKALINVEFISFFANEGGGLIGGWSDKGTYKFRERSGKARFSQKPPPSPLYWSSPLVLERVVGVIVSRCSCGWLVTMLANISVIISFSPSPPFSWSYPPPLSTFCQTPSLRPKIRSWLYFHLG